MIGGATFAWTTALHWAAVVCYVLVTILAIAAAFFKKEHWERPVPGILTAGLVLQGIGILVWWKAVGHGPYLDRFEVLSSNAWILTTAYALSSMKFPRLKPVRFVIFPVSFFLIAVGLLLRPEMTYLPPTFRSIWLVIHILFYKIALAAMIIALALSVYVILLSTKRSRPCTLLSLSSGDGDLMAYRFSGFGFVFWAFGMIAGSIWAYQSWNIFWNWDPVQIWSLIAWLSFALYLHLRRFFGWHGSRAAWLFTACFVFAIISLFLTPFFNTTVHAEYFK